MGRRLNLSTPTVISTELMPLDESFYIEADGQLEQWYYDNTSEYSPNRTVTPLVLTPHLSLFDGDTKQSYTPVLGGARWFEKSWDVTEGDYVETEITNTVDSSSAEYVKVGNTLRVKKNVTYSHAVTIRCVQPYSDPRDNSFAYSISATVLLSTNRDATVIYPTLDIDAPTAQSYNPLTDASSQFVLKAQANWAKSYVTDIMKYEVDALGTESVQPMNDTDIVTATPSLDLRYGALEQSDQMFQLRQTANGASFEGNVGVINDIKGNAFAWNQSLQAKVFKIDSRTIASSVVKNDDGSYEITLLSSPESNTNISYSVSFPANHAFFLNVNGDGEYIGIRSPSHGDVKGKKILSAKSNGFSILIRAFANAPANTVLKIRPVMIDLTLLGIDSLTTVEEVEAWLAQNVGLRDYYPYNAGELLPVRMTGMKTAGFNQMSIGSKVGQWNQGFSYTNRTLSHNGVTFTISNGLVTTSNTATASGGRNTNISGQNCPLRKGHMYYPRLVFLEGSGSNLTFFISWVSSYMTLRTNTIITYDGEDAVDTDVAFWGVNVLSGVNYDGRSFYLNIIDLTQLFGTGNEPSTVAEFEAWLQKYKGGLDYYAYNTGTEETYQVGLVKTLANKTYRVEGAKAFINGATLSNNDFTGDGGDVVVWGQDGTTCVHISDASRNGTYEPYWEKLASVPVTTLKGKLNGQGNSVVVFPDGMKRYGSVYDEIYVENGVTKAIKRMGSVDMGTLTWTTQGNYKFFTVFLSGAKKPPSNFVKANILTVGYTTTDSATAESTNMCIGISQGGYIRLRDNRYLVNDVPDVPAFKAAISGQTLYYELATPQVYVLDPLPRGEFEWYGIQNNAEVKVETLPWYVSGQNTDTLTVDAMYGESIRVVLRARGEAMADLFPNKVYRTIDWRTPDIDTHVVSRNGGAVRGDTDSMDFTTIVNVLKGVLSDAKKAEHLRFNWKTRRGNQSTETDAGWGDLVNIPASQLRNSYVNQHLASTLVFPYVYLKGAYEGVTDNGEAVTDGGEQVIDRPIAD